MVAVYKVSADDQQIEYDVKVKMFFFFFFPLSSLNFHNKSPKRS
jgi:hypothetical protein